MKIPSATTAAVITLAAIAIAAVTASIAGPAGSARPAGLVTGSHVAQDGSVSHGRYLVSIAGCHDCHTAGYAQSGGHAPPTNWLTGSAVGFQGPWGVSYPANLRLTVQSMTEAEWLVFARAERRPPMPWFNLRAMNDQDLTDIYRYIRSLGAAGEPAPLAVAPGGKVTTPSIDFVPHN
jgi:mono/diheme cytochrome c family protein